MSYKLICFDMDGVIFKDENFWMSLHTKLGTLEKGKKLTDKFLHKNYSKLVEEVVGGLWRGKSAKPYFELINSLKYIDGVEETINYAKKKKYITAIISASSIDVAKRAQKDYGIDYVFANELIIKNNKISGEFIWPVGPGKEYKAKIMNNLCKELGIKKQEVIYVGDSDTDFEAFKEAGLSIAFNSSSEKLKKIANHVVDSNNLASIIKFI